MVARHSTAHSEAPLKAKATRTQLSHTTVSTRQAAPTAISGSIAGDRPYTQGPKTRTRQTIKGFLNSIWLSKRDSVEYWPQCAQEPNRRHLDIRPGQVKAAGTLWTPPKRTGAGRQPNHRRGGRGAGALLHLQLRVWDGGVFTSKPPPLRNLHSRAKWAASTL